MNNIMSDIKENQYKDKVFLENLRYSKNRSNNIFWKTHQQMQVDFLYKNGFNEKSLILDIGCGPLRLGSDIIPKLKTGWYYGQDINKETLIYGEEVLRENNIKKSSRYTLICSENFNFSEIKTLVDIAFSNSLFTHLTINSIMTCLYNVEKILNPEGFYYSTFFNVENHNKWEIPQKRNKWGSIFYTYPCTDPYHYNSSFLKKISLDIGLHMDIVKDYDHPVQTMACFYKLKKKYFI